LACSKKSAFACAEQQLGDGLVPVLGGSRQRRPAGFVYRVEIDPALIFPFQNGHQ
jgi:hypothetical protein